MSAHNPSQRIIISGVQTLSSDAPQTLIIQDGLVESLSSGQADAAAVEPRQRQGETSSDTSTIQVDAHGLTAVPGLCDLYTRLREPGMTRKGTIASETRAALQAGFTRLLCAPDTSPVIDSVSTVELIRQRAQAAAGAQVYPMAALTTGLDGEHLSELATLQRVGCPVASHADVPLGNATVLISAMEYAASFNLPLCMTARDAELGAYGCAHAGAVATRLGLPGIPVAAETVALAKLLELCREVRCRLHISRISSARGVQMINDAKQDGLPVTCDTGLHHLFFTEDHLAGYDASFHSAVPFRSAADRDALRQGVRTGIIDAICTDHAPHDVDASLAPFPATEPGLSAYTWSMPLILQLPELLQMDLAAVFHKLSLAPRSLLDDTAPTGLEAGKPAEFFLLDRQAELVQSESADLKAGANHPLHTHSAASLQLEALRGKVTHVIHQQRWHEFP